MNGLLRTSNEFTFTAPKSFTQFLQTRRERCSIVREKLEGCSIEMRGGFPDWKRVGEWFVEEVLAETNALVNSQKAVALEERWQSFCVDLATLLGEQIISRSSSVDWEYHVGTPQMWPANEVVLRSRNDPEFVGMPLLSALYATRMRSLHLNDPNGPLGEARPVSVRKQDIASEKLTVQEIFNHAENRFIEDKSARPSKESRERNSEGWRTMNWARYSSFNWPKLVSSVAEYSDGVPEYFATFQQTIDSRLKNVRAFLVSQGLELRSGFPNWLEVGDWLIASIDGPVDNSIESISDSEYERRWRSLCCDIGTLFGAQLITLFPNCFWDYYVGSPREIGANEIVVTDSDANVSIRIFALSCISGSRARIARLKFPTSALKAEVSNADLTRELNDERYSIAKYFDLCIRDLTASTPHEVAFKSDNPFLHDSNEWQLYEEARRSKSSTSLLVESKSGDNDSRREWVRIVTNFDQRGVSLETDSSIDYWILWTNISEQLREDSLYEELQIGIEATLREFNGITQFSPQDREIWYVYGDLDGPALIDAIGSVVDEIANRLNRE